MKKFTVFALIISCFVSLHSYADKMTCTGDLKLMSDSDHPNPKLRDKVFRPENLTINIEQKDSLAFYVLDQNEKKLAKVWPWVALNAKAILLPMEQQKRHMILKSNGINNFSIQIDSTSSKAVNKIYCEVEETL